MSKVVYLLGAGASCNALPLNAKIGSAIEDSIRFMHNNSNKISGSAIFYNFLEREFQFLYQICESYVSIDTYAKKLNIQRRYNELKQLKLSIAALFQVVENLKTIDNRYDAFWASILDSVNNLPKLQILSWNYDLQLERSFSEFVQDDLLNVIKSRFILRRNSEKDSLNKNLNIIKLNGDISLSQIDNHTLNFISFDKRDGNSISNFLNSWKYYSDNLTESLTNIFFAWEKESDNFSTLLANSLSDAEVLVIIGYSYPYYNRKRDVSIYESMGRLGKVYIQCGDDNFNVEEKIRGIYESFASRTLPEFKHVNDTRFFLVPNEFTGK